MALDRARSVLGTALVGWAVCALLTSGAPAAADDRDLLRESSGEPYVFVLFDTSGSMHWTPRCTQDGIDAGDCLELCPTGDCYAALNGDDPSSKLYQAKEAIHEVLQTVDGVQFGFATYNQDRLRVRAKHWLYTFASFQPDGTTANQGIALDSGTRYPQEGAEEVFGLEWECDNGNNSSIRARGCRAEYPADLDDAWEVRRVGLLPKHCDTQDCNKTVYIRDDADGKRYRVRYWQDDRDSWPYGATKYRSKLKIWRCNNNSCSDRTLKGEKHVYYDLEDEFLAWDVGADRGPLKMGFFSQGEASDQRASDTCDGLDLNDDSDSDRYPDDASDYSLRWPTDASDARNDTDNDGTNEIDAFDFGDQIPLDWNDDHKADVLARLAPGTRGGEPYFGVAGYFRDDQKGTCSNNNAACYKDADCADANTCDDREDFLRLKDSTERPVIAFGATPLGNSIKDFRTWYTGCSAGACPHSTGWEDIAAVQDPSWACRKKYLLVITDGDETCSGPDACSGTAGLRAQAGIKTFVVAFGVQNSPGNRLTCMAANGGTGDPIFPQNKQELIDALTDIFNSIRIEARSFASASVPTVQNETSDKIYLSSFTPIPQISVWPGRIDAYRKPLPLNDDATPFTPPPAGSGLPCARCCEQAGLQAACHLWNAGDELLQQAPTPVEADLGDLKLGMTTGQRRVLYGQEPDPDDADLDVPNALRLFEPPVSQPDQYDLWRGLGLIDAGAGIGDLTAAQDAAAVAATRTIVGNVLKIKTEVIEDPDGFAPDQVFEYVLGDIFHSDPEIITSPNHLRYFRNDLNGYREFADRHFWRRKMLAVASNDGQLHFFDAGIRKLVFDPTLGRNVALFTDGTGLELFSYMPRLALPVIGEQFDDTAVSEPRVEGAHIYSLDGQMTVGDVHIDPDHHGDDVDAADRGWRTLLVAGLREGGDIMGGGAVPGFVSGYFALDVTQPDELETPSPTPQDPFPKPHPSPVGRAVPNCLVINGDGKQGTSADCPTPSGQPFRFPAELWTFTDRVIDPDPGNRELLFLDEDDQQYPLDPALNLVPVPEGNGIRDLGDSWSKPVLAQIQVCTGSECDPGFEPNDVESRFVAIFGGGLDSQTPSAVGRGNWLYMVDVETGEAIYKRQLAGSVAGGPAAIDRDQDGVIDVLYVATTGGFLYKVDLTGRTIAGEVPALTDVVLGNDSLLGDPLAAGSSVTVERITDPSWDPFPIFDTGGRPVYMTPTVILVPELDQYAIAFGTGDRANLWQRDGVVGRFYTIVDEDYERVDSRPLPRTESNYQSVSFDALATSGNYLLDRAAGTRGWVLVLEEDDRVVTQAFALVSVLVFTSFKPQEADPFDEDGNPTEACARTGRSRIFVVDATNANAFTDLDQLTDSVKERYLDVGDFTTAPYVDQTATKNPFPDGGSAGGDHTESTLDPTQAALQEEIRRALMKYFPEGCRFNKAFSMTVNASRSDTGFLRYATIPIAMCPVDWKER